MLPCDDVADVVLLDVRSEVVPALELALDEGAAVGATALLGEVVPPVDVELTTLLTVATELAVPDESVSADEAVAGCSPLS